MRVLLIAIMGLFGIQSATAQSHPGEDEISVFLSLVQTGGADAVKSALQANPDLATASDKYGYQPVHVLDYTDFLEILALLTWHGADVNAQNSDGHALLHILIDAEFLPIVLEAGADLELRDIRGRTALMTHLSEPDNLQMLAALLAAGADPNATDRAGQSALHHANGVPDYVALLKDYGAEE